MWTWRKRLKPFKMSWIGRLFDKNCPGKFKHTMIEILNQYKQANLGKIVFKTFLNTYYIRQLPTYYNKLLTAWANFLQDKRYKPSNIKQILTEPLFDNRFVVTGNLGDQHVIFFPGWCKNGITQIQHITYDGVIPKLLHNEAIKEVLADKAKGALQQHKQILQSIPKDWKDFLNTQTGKPDETFYVKLDAEPKLITTLDCKTLYNELLRDETYSVDHSYKQKWTNTSGPVDWDKIFKNLQKRNFDRKANDMRWKIIHRCIPTARRLAGRWPFFNTSTCKVCENMKQIQHICFIYVPVQKRSGTM